VWTAGTIFGLDWPGSSAARTLQPLLECLSTSTVSAAARDAGSQAASTLLKDLAPPSRFPPLGTIATIATIATLRKSGGPWSTSLPDFCLLADARDPRTLRCQSTRFPSQLYEEFEGIEVTIVAGWAGRMADRSTATSYTGLPRTRHPWRQLCHYREQPPRPSWPLVWVFCGTARRCSAAGLVGAASYCPSHVV